jgi:recombination protein RecT
MAVQNSLTKKVQRPKFSVVIQQDAYKNLINNTLGDPKRVQKFIASVSSAVAVNPDLQECEAGTILSAALLGDSLNLSPSPQLGQYYMIPYEDNKNNRKVATFQIGYKGYIQLAIRSGYYKKLNVLPIKEGELKHYDPLNEEIEVELIEDEEVRENTPTMGYYTMFEYQNGFRKAIYWSKTKMERHALTYSKGYAADKKKGTAWTFWSKSFDDMACKTMLRQLISKWGIMSIELQTAIEKDMAVIDETGKVEYVDNLDFEDVGFENVVDVPEPEIIEPTEPKKEQKANTQKKARSVQADVQEEFFSN